MEDGKGAFTLNADRSAVEVRLDIFISHKLPHFSRSQISNLIKQGHIRVSGQIRKAGYHLKPGEVVTGTIPPAVPSEFTPEPIPFGIIYEDRQIIVVDKPPGLVVHPAPGHFNGTLVNALLHHCPDLKGIGGEIRPGIVHRLDKDTSGVMVVAKDDRTHLALSAQFKSRDITKEYIALTYGRWETDKGKIVLPIGRHPSDRKKMSIHSTKGRYAETHWKVERTFKGLSLVSADLKTGRTHQIRVHFAAMNHPILGDPVYAGRKMLLRLPPETRIHAAIINRQMLHSRRLGFLHPETKKAMSFDSQLPQDMALLIDRLTGASSGDQLSG